MAGVKPFQTVIVIMAKQTDFGFWTTKFIYAGKLDKQHTRGNKNITETSTGLLSFAYFLPVV